VPGGSISAPAGGASQGGESRARRVGRAWFDRLEARLASSSISDSSALAAAAASGALRAALSGRWPSAREVSALYGTSRFESRRIAIGIAANEARNRLVVRRTAGSPVAAFVRRVGFADEARRAELQPPMVLITAHVGALHLLAAGLDQLPAQRVTLRWAPLHLPGRGEESALTGGAVGSRTEALRKALAALGDGKLVVTALEGPHGSAIPGELLGRRVDFGRGGFALARLGAARIVPVAAVWEGSRVRVVCGSPVAGSADAPAAVSSWFEALLRRSPRQLSLGLLRRLLEGPAG
jgi:hypothetical protein